MDRFEIETSAGVESDKVKVPILNVENCFTQLYFGDLL